MSKNNAMEELSDLKITVGLVTYNRPEFLKEAVHSVLQQSYKNFELLISNDYVESEVTLESLGIMNDSRIKIINQESNLGEIRNLNYLLEIAQSEWFVWLADDDLFHPEFLMLAKDVILDNRSSNIVGFFSNYSAANSPNDVFPKPLKSSNCLYFDAKSFLFEYTARKIPLVGCYGIMRISTLRKVGGIPRLGDSFGPYGDTLIPILLIEHGNLCWLDESLIFFRSHAESLSNKSIEFSAFSSAEDDFLRSLKRVCASKNVSISPERVIANMVGWFTGNEWSVLSRNVSLSGFVVAKEFIKYQININIPRLSLRHSIFHILSLFRFLGKLFISKSYKAVLSAIEKGLSACLKTRP
jgi:glycosyltransferase involved in cell wall biosynthesis